MFLWARAPHRTPPFLDNPASRDLLITHSLQCEKFPRQLSNMDHQKVLRRRRQMPPRLPSNLRDFDEEKLLASV